MAAIECFGSLKQAPRRLTIPDYPVPTSSALTKSFYPRAEEIVGEIGKMLGREIDVREITQSRRTPHDVPGDWFKGPF